MFLSDRGKNIKYGLLRNGFIRLSCYAHLIHNLVCYMLDDEYVKEIVNQAAKLSSYVKNSGLNKHLKTSLKRHTSTRWNSVYVMLKAISDNYRDVYELLVTKQRLLNEARWKNKQQTNNEISELITALEPEKMDELIKFLVPFKVLKDFF